MSTYITSVTVPLSITAPDFETAVKLAELAATAAVSAASEHMETTAGDPRLNRLERVHGVDRLMVARHAVRQALEDALINHRHMQTAPHPRDIRDRGLKLGGINLADDEIQAALVVEMAR